MVRAGVVFWQVAEGANGPAACLLRLMLAPPRWKHRIQLVVCLSVTLGRHIRGPLPRNIEGLDNELGSFGDILGWLFSQ